MNPDDASPQEALRPTQQQPANIVERPTLRENPAPAWTQGEPRMQADGATQNVPEASGGPLDAGSIARTSIGLAIVIVLILVCSALLRRFGPYRRAGGRSLDIVASQSVGPRERVVVVEVEDTWLVLGVAANSVNTLHSLPAKERPTGRPATGSSANPTFGAAFAENLRRATERFSRRER